jgi:hypothetical protein
VRVARSDAQPAAPDSRDGKPRVRYVARFADSEAALMHTHALLRRRLVDAEAGLYRTDLVQAVAAVDSLGLSHRGVFLDPALPEETQAEIRACVGRLVRRRRRIDRLCYAVGYGALLWLLLRGLSDLV